jgi:hypothetical protein
MFFPYNNMCNVAYLRQTHKLYICMYWIVFEIGLGVAAEIAAQTIAAEDPDR